MIVSWVIHYSTCSNLTTRLLQSRTNKTFTISVQVPPTGRFANLRSPVKGTLVSLHGILSGITTTELASIDMESVTFISISNANRQVLPATKAPTSGSTTVLGLGPVARTKRERHLEQENNSSKRIRIGPPEMFLTGTALEDFSGESLAEKASGAGTSQTRSKTKAK
jgi:hypothetical protein